jgi:hypothetical protein
MMADSTKKEMPKIDDAAVEQGTDSTTEKVQKSRKSRGSMSGDAKAGADTTVEKVQKRRSRGSMTAPKDS